MNRRAGEGSYRVAAPCPTSDLASLLERLHQAAGPGEAVLVGFDFPIGLPARRLFWTLGGQQVGKIDMIYRMKEEDPRCPHPVYPVNPVKMDG